MKISSVYLYGFTHWGLDMEGSNIIPALLEEGHQKVDGCTQVLSELIFIHFISTKSCTEGQCALQLESEK